MGADHLDPVPGGLGDELRSVVRADIGWNATQDEQVRQDIDHIGRVELALYPDGQAFATELVDDIQRTEGPSILRPVMNEVIRPDMVSVLWPQTDA